MKYIKPTVEVIEFDTEDVIVTSGLIDMGGGHQPTDPTPWSLDPDNMMN